MRQLFKGNIKLIRQIFSAGFFHFIHAFASILLLLMVGQIISQSDSTKSRLLQLLTLDNFHLVFQWYWVIVLLIIKFIGTSLRNYYLQYAPFNMQIALQNFWLAQNIRDKDFYPDKDIKNYARAYIKGRILWVADICLLLLIFLLLFHLNIWVAFFWLILWIIGMLFRWWVVHHYLTAKNEWKITKTSLQRKWKFVFLNQYLLKRDQQWKKEVRILKRREEKSEDKFKLFGFQKAWTSGFFPVYFFSFVFLLASVFQRTGSDHTIILQLILMIIYSQGAFMRSFKAPEYWRVIKLIEKKWYTVIQVSNDSTTNSTTHKDDLFSDLQKKDLESLSENDWVRILPLFYVKDPVDEFYYKHIFRTAALLDADQPLIGETFLSAIISDKENKQLPVLNDFFPVFGNDEWSRFPWKNKFDQRKCSDREYRWLHIFKALLHPGKIIICKGDIGKIIEQNDFDIFLTLVDKRNKKIIYINEEHF